MAVITLLTLAYLDFQEQESKGAKALWQQSSVTVKHKVYPSLHGPLLDVQPCMVFLLVNISKLSGKYEIILFFSPKRN